MPDGPGRFTQNSSCSALLRIPLCFVSLRIPDCHRLWSVFPDCSSHEISCNSAVLQPHTCRNTYGLGSSPFARHYWGNHCYFLYSRIKGYLHLPVTFRSLSRPSSPPRAKASAMRPCLLSLSRHTDLQCGMIYTSSFRTFLFACYIMS